MELQFENRSISCLDWAVREVQTQELTQEVKLSEGQPDAGKILTVRGQCVLRSKEWRGSGIGISGGVMVWTLYRPEEGGDPVCVESWIPFQMKWLIPEGTREGAIRICCSTEGADARIVSARRLILRVNLSVLAEALEPKQEEFWYPPEDTGSVQLLRRTYPVRLLREAGEKAFTLEETLELPAGQPKPEKLLGWRVEPTVLEQKVVGDRLVFRGVGKLHGLCQDGNGRVFSCELELPYSQLGELDREYGEDGQGEIALAVTGFEAELEDGRIGVKCGLTAQYLVSDREMLELAEDAYCLNASLEITRDTLELPVLLDWASRDAVGEATLPEVSGDVVEVAAVLSQPRVNYCGEEREVTVPALAQMLYYDREGVLQGTEQGLELGCSVPADGDADVYAALTPQNPQVRFQGEGAVMTVPVSLGICAASVTKLPMISGVTLGEVREPDPARPSLILRKAGEDGLWALAKRCGSTVEAIRSANRLQTEPVGDPILLIPVL